MPLVLSGDGITSDNITSLAASKLTGQVPDANAPSGGVIQVVNVTTVQWSYQGSTSTYTEMSSSLRASITPSSSSSRIIVAYSGGRLSYTSAPTNNRVEVQRSINGGSSWNAVHRFAQDLRYDADNYGFPLTCLFIDSPNTTSSTMYSLFASVTQGTCGHECGSTDQEKTRITLMEIAA
jgi:hypothetical protein